MLRHPSFHPLSRCRLVLLPAISLLSAGPGLLAQGDAAASSSLAASASQPADCSDISDAPCPPPPTPAPHTRPHVETSISLGAFAQITPTRLQNNTYDGTLLSTQTQGIAPTAGVLGTVRQQFRPWLGYSLNLGYTRADERYTFPSSLPGTDLHVPSNLYELSLSYVAEKRLTPRLSGFADIGAGFITVLPIIRYPTPAAQPDYHYPSVNFRPEGVTGFGLDLRLTHRLDFRAEYRGLLYKNPDFGGLQKSTTWTSEPTLSLVYRFGRTRPASPKQP